MDDSNTPPQINDDNLDTNPAAAGGNDSPELLQDLANVGINPGEEGPASPETLDDAISQGDDPSRMNPTPISSQNQDYSVEPLSQDFESSASPATDTSADAGQDMDRQIESNQLDDTHQATDNASDIDATELYDEGLSGAAEAEEPNAGNAVTGFKPEDSTEE